MTIYVRPEVLPAWAESGDKIEPTTGQIQSGWVASEIPPARQRFNWAMNYNANGVRYLTQRGIPEWNADEDYPSGACVIYSGLTYKAALANTNKQPDTNPTEWARWALTSAELGATYLQKSSNLSDVANTATALSNLGGVNSAFVYGRTGSSGPVNFRNKIINGNFNVWQRATTFSSPASLSYTSDRWSVLTGGTVGTFTVSRQSFAVGDSTRTQSTYYLQWAQSTAGSASSRSIVQKIEGVRTFAGETVTISFMAWADASTDITVSLTQSFGTGGSPSSDVTQTSSTITINTSPTVYTVSLTLAGISGKTLGSSSNDSLNLLFNLPLSSTFTFNLSAVQVESGTVATAYEQLPYDIEFSACQRYFEVNRVENIAYTANNQGVRSTISFAAVKRKVPSITTSNVSFVNSSTLTTSVQVGMMSSQVLASSTAPTGVSFDFTADAEL